MVCLALEVLETSSRPGASSTKVPQSSQSICISRAILERWRSKLPRATNTVEGLVVLLRQAGHLVTKDELLSQVWPDAIVEEGILTVHISALRKALGDDRRSSGYIETVSKSGYRFVAPVSREHGDHDTGRLRAQSRPVELYELVGRGRARVLSGSYFEVPDAVSSFRAAIELDPTYAAAHAGLAVARCLQGCLRAVPYEEAFAEAKSVGSARAGDGQRVR